MVEIYITEMNKLIKTLKGNPNHGLKFKRLEEDSLYVRVYIDASFSTNKYCSSQLGFVILVFDNNDRCHVLNFASRNFRRVVRSIIG